MRASWLFLGGITGLVALAGCRLPSSVPTLPAGVTRFEGTVVGPDGGAIPTAPIALLRLGDTHLPTRYRDVITDSRGRFVVDVGEPGRYRIETRFPGCRPYSVDLDAPRGGTYHELRIQLSPLEDSRVSGMLLGLDGLPLGTAELALLFPSLAGHDELLATPGPDGVDEIFPFTGDSELVARYRIGDALGEAIADVDLDDGSFDVRVPATSSGTIELRFRGATVATSDGFLPGDGLAELWVDTEGLRATLSTLEVMVGGPRSGAVTLRVARLGRGGLGVRDELALRGVPPRLRLVGVPADRYALVATAGATGATRVTDVKRDASAIHDLTLEPTGELIVSLDDADGGRSLEVAAADLNVRTREGVLLTETARAFDATPSGVTVRLSGLPAGPVIVHAADHAVAAVVAPTTATEVPLPLRTTWRKTLRFALPDDAVRAGPTDAKVTISTRDGVLLREIPFVLPPGPAGSVEIQSPSGRYIVAIDLGSSDVLRDELVFAERDETLTISRQP